MLRYFIDSTLFSLLYPVILVGMLIAGYLIAKLRYKRKGKIWSPSGTEGPIIGFFALLLSFTFLASNNVMRERTSLVHRDADAIAALRRESLLYSEDYKKITKKYLIKYTDQQIAFYSAGDYRQAEKIKAQTEDLNGQYLTDILSIGNGGADTKVELHGLYPHYNSLSSGFHAVTYSFAERIPLLIILLLIVASLLISILVGFMNGFYEGGRHLLVPLIFLVLVTFSIHAIRDMDNPLKGTIKPKIDNLEDIRMSLMKTTK